ncbi:MAG: 30S ribosomal protein S12 methylthiotransferase RimO, partial [Chloroflexota bacterium]|nr:30S ribosomal protein S12 methylthiotransferase RimO [Chloroflexota bacterium]
MKRANYYLLTLGCPKNEVDSQGMERLLQEAGYASVDNPSAARFLIVNTCGFIDVAKEESIEALRKLAEIKQPEQFLIAAGCLSQRYGRKLIEEVPALDGVIGTRRWMKIVTLLEKLSAGESAVMVGNPPSSSADRAHRFVVKGASAYLEIAEGCSASCAFCAIPLIKGPACSRPAEAVVEDTRRLASQGIKEVILIAQDTTAYGWDRGERDGLASLIERIPAAAPELRWLRIMYAYPQHITPRLIEVMASHPQICHYLDMPLQHAHPDVLRRMNRPSNVEGVRQLIERLRKAMPDIALRTSFIVGYPGETDEESETLLDFVQEMAFDKMGAFTYSREEGTPAAELPHQISEEVKRQRYNRLMSVQRSISLAKNKTQMGRTLDVLIEGRGDGLSVGRSYRDAPEIDGLVLVEGELTPGEMVPVRIT